MKIKIGDTRSLGSNPMREFCKTGRIYGGKYVRGNLTIMVQDVFGSKTFINKEVLRQALLQNKAFVEKELGIKIIEIDNATGSPLPEDMKPVTEKELEELDQEVILD